MSLTVTLHLSELIAQRAKEVAVSRHRDLEDVLVEWLDRAAVEPPIESLTDDQVTALCDLQLEPAQQTKLSELLTHNREGQITTDELRELDDLMAAYRRELVRKAGAWRIAVQRGLRAPLN